MPKSRILVVIFGLALLPLNSLASSGTGVPVPDAIVQILRQTNVNVNDLKSEDISGSFEAFPVKLSSTGAAGVVVVGTSESGFCGATGNCSFWVFMSTASGYRLVLDAGLAQSWRLVWSKNAQSADIQTQTHGSATETDYVLYRYSGTRYRPIRCWRELYAGLDGQGNKVTFDPPMTVATECVDTWGSFRK